MKAQLDFILHCRRCGGELQAWTSAFGPFFLHGSGTQACPPAGVQGWAEPDYESAADGLANEISRSIRDQT